MSAPEHGSSAADLARALPVERDATAGDLRAVSAVGRNSSVAVGRDALGNVFVTGDGNTVEVKLTVVVADTRLAAPDASADASTLQNPYRGLDAFRETDSALFFGREDLITRLWIKFQALQRGQAPRLLPILGASGSGKSSLVRAGLLPELVRQPMEGMRSPTVLVLRPGANPWQRLVDVLARGTHDGGRVEADGKGPPPDAGDTLHRAAQALGAADQRVIVFVDQLEELFTECTSETMRSAFLATLAHAAMQPDGLVSVIFAMRNDFAGSLRAHEAFAAAVREQRFTVSQMTRGQLVDAIEQPARMLGHPWPDGLVENLVLQCEGRAGALPLLQFALKRLWSERLAGRLSESRWSSRLIEDFVVLVADTLFEGTGQVRDREANQRIIRRAFLAMVQLGEGTADTRRVARLSEIVARRETGEQVRAVLAPFVAPEARLVTASEIDGEPAYELAHEALIGSWDRLSEWLGNVARKVDAEAIRGDVRLRRRLRYAADAWRIDRDALLRPPELELAATLRDRDPEELSTREHELIDASLAAWKAHGRWRRRVRMAIGALSIAFFVGVSISALVAWRQANEAERQRRDAEHERDRRNRLVAESAQFYQETGRQRLLEAERPLEALPYLVEARASAEAIGSKPSASLRMLFAQAIRNLPVAPPLRHRGGVRGAAFSPDGTRVVTASDDQTARVWDAASGKLLLPPLRHRGVVLSTAFSPDGTRVVTASLDNTAQVWDAASGEPLSLPLQHQDDVWSAAFSPDGTRVVTASDDHTARVWDAASGKPLSPPLQHQDVVESAAFSPDGTRIVTASLDKTARVWDAVTGKPLAPPLQHQDSVESVAFSPDGTRVVTASDDHTARIWDAASGTPLSPPLQHQGVVQSAAFSPDGTRVVTASWDDTAQVWDAPSSTLLSSPLRHQGAVWSAAFSPDGTRVVTASLDNTARVWDAVSGKPLSPPLQHQGIVWSAAFSPDGTRVVTASDDDTARVWDLPLASGTLAEWRALTDRASPYVLANGVLSLRPVDGDATSAISTRSTSSASPP